MPDETLREVSTPGVNVDRDLLEEIVTKIDALAPGVPTRDQVTKVTATKKTPGARPAAPAGKYVITASTSIGTNRWKYTVKPVIGGGTSHHGLLPVPDEYEVRNTEEELTMGGYISSAVTALRPITTGRIVDCWWSTRKEGDTDKPQFLFTRDNEPICS